MLMGSNKFCNQAMVWLRRFGVIYIHFYHTMSRAVQDTIGTYFHLRYDNKLELKCETRCPNVASTCSVNLWFVLGFFDKSQSCIRGSYACRCNYLVSIALVLHYLGNSLMLLRTTLLFLLLIAT
jgi:hypothetical protein